MAIVIPLMALRGIIFCGPRKRP